MSYLEFITYSAVCIIIGGIFGWFFGFQWQGIKKTKWYYQITPKTLKKYQVKDTKL
jgi:hypothetical protein